MTDETDGKDGFRYQLVVGIAERALKDRTRGRIAKRAESPSNLNADCTMLTILRIFERFQKIWDLILRHQRTERADGLGSNIIAEVFLHGQRQRLLGRGFDLNFRPDDRGVWLQEDALHPIENGAKGAGILDWNVQSQQRIDGL